MLKFGANMHSDQINIAPNATYNGTFMFQGTETGSDFADYLLGVASVFAQGDSKHFYPRNKYIGLYAQDRWQATSTLTFNYGLRWDMLPAWREKYNQFQTAVLGQQSVEQIEARRIAGSAVEAAHVVLDELPHGRRGGEQLEQADPAPLDLRLPAGQALGARVGVGGNGREPRDQRLEPAQLGMLGA